jgi:hypothetical protein
MKCRYIEPEPDIDVSSGHIYTYTNKPVCSYAPHQVESLSFFIIIIVFVSVEKIVPESASPNYYGFQDTISKKRLFRVASRSSNFPHLPYVLRDDSLTRYILIYQSTICAI